MSTLHLSLWIVFGLLGIVASALFSGLEIGMYRLNRVRLHLLAQQGQSSAKTLAGLLRTKSALLATLLITNNLANHISSSATSIVLESYDLSPWQVIGVSCLVITPLLFVFGETLPKDAFAAHADRLVYPFVRLLWLLRWFFTFIGVLPFILFISELPMRFMGGKQRGVGLHPRHQMNMLVREGVGYGLLSDEQSAIVQRVLELGSATVGHEMTPWKKVLRITPKQGTADLWKFAEETSVSRFPVMDDQGKVNGVVSLYDALCYTQDQCPSVDDLIKPAIFFERNTPVRTALATLRDKHGTLGIVMDRNKPVGLVTIKDLIEPVTGELASW